MSDSSDKASDRWHIRVRPIGPQLDGHGRDVLADCRRIGFESLEEVRSSRIYLLEGHLNEIDVQLIGAALLADPVAERFEFGPGFVQREDSAPAIEVHPLPGVMNPVAKSSAAAIHRLLRAKGRHGARVAEVGVGRRYEVIGARHAVELEQIACRILANACIEAWYIRGFGRDDALPEQFPRPLERSFELRTVPIRGLDDESLATLSREAHLFLSLEEMKAIRAHFVALRRDPTDLELETLAQTWSEHCVHKTLKSPFIYRGLAFPDGQGFAPAGDSPVEVRFDNLLKDTIVAATRTLNREWCLSVFVDNAGIIAFDDDYGVAFKVETHNHPSAIEPYGGAATGVGGCIRDIMGCGLGAKPIASTDVFGLAPPDFDDSRLPRDVLHPRRVLKGVVSGVRDYGNRMGIPTINGAIYFDARYLANPLVFCGCVGLIPCNRIEKEAKPADLIVLAGGRTGRDGIHGATFSSAELTDSHADEFAHAVQIGNAIEEKKLLDALLIARDHEKGCLFRSVTDCGAGGLSSAVGEMSADLGAVVDLEKVPLKYVGLRYDEIWISEAQERMVFAVAPDRLDEFIRVLEAEEVEATVIGVFGSDQVLRVRYRGSVVGELDMAFLHDGLPRITKNARWSVYRPTDSKPEPGRFASRRFSREALLAALGNLNVASKEWVIRQYDHEVQSRSVIKPLVGPGFGPSDAAVLRPRLDSYRGVAVGCGLCPSGSGKDPYWMAVEAVDEALRNVLCVCADIFRTAILDNFCWPKVDNEESLGALVRACKGAADAAIAYGLPFISGKDSLNNEFVMTEAESLRTGLPRRLAIPYTLLISSIGVVADVRRCVSMDLKRPGNVLALASAPVTQVGLAGAFALHRKVADAMAKGSVRSAHDVSDGGLGVALAEMCIAGNVGASIELDLKKFAWDPLGDLPTTYILEMSAADARDAGFPVIGEVEAKPRLVIRREADGVLEWSVGELANAWRSPLPSLAGA